MSNYAIFPQKVLNVTQRYDGSYSHAPNSEGDYKDYPIDIADATTGREAFYAPCRMVCVKIYRSPNGAWFTSTDPVDFPDGTSDFLTVKFVHMNDSDFAGENRIRVGRVYERAERIGYEGTSGATANHIHFTAGKGRMDPACGGWRQNNRGAWVLQTTGGTAKPEALIYVDPTFTTIQNSNGIAFKTLPQTPETAFSAGDAVRLKRGAAIYFGKDEASAALTAAESECVKVWDVKQGAHPYFISTADWDGDANGGSGIGWVDESALEPWQGLYANGTLVRLKAGAGVYAGHAQTDAAYAVDPSVCVKVWDCKVGNHPYFVSTTGWDGGTGDVVHEHGVGWVDERDLEPWTWLYEVGQTVKYWGGDVFSSLNGVESGYPVSGAWTVAKVIDRKEGEHPYLLRDLHTDVVMGWVAETTCGAYTSDDANFAAQYVMGRHGMTEDQIGIYDVDGDGAVTLQDATEIAKIVKGLA